jgi:hypothetical protein
MTDGVPLDSALSRRHQGVRLLRDTDLLGSCGRRTALGNLQLRGAELRDDPFRPELLHLWNRDASMN